MNLDTIKNKLSALNNAGQKTQREKIDYTKIFWKPTPGKYEIRIVPSKFSTESPFREVYIHYGFTKYPLYALSNWGEKDPIIEFAKKLKQSGGTDNRALAKKIEPKVRIFAPVIVRGEEEKGVRLWEFGNTIYKTLLGFAADEDYGDFTDINEGRDFKVDVIQKEVMGKTSNQAELRPKPKTSKLSNDSTLISKWLEEQPDILSINPKKSFDEIKTILENFLSPPDNNDSQSESSEPSVLSNNEQFASTSSKFDKLFEEAQ